MKRPTAPATARITAQQLRAARQRRSAEMKRRNEAIKRRQVLTLTLLGLTVLTVALGAFSVLSPWWLIVPGGLLSAVLIQGRRVAIAYARADAKRDRRIDELERRLDHLQARSLRALTDLGATRVQKDEGGELIENTGAHQASRGVKTAAQGSVTASEIPEAVIADATWEPVAIPAPTYTLKATAVRPPLKPEADVLPAAERETGVPLRPTRATMLNGSPADEAAAPERPVFDLDSALARRRAAGE